MRTLINGPNILWPLWPTKLKQNFRDKWKYYFFWYAHCRDYFEFWTDIWKNIWEAIYTCWSRLKMTNNQRSMRESLISMLSALFSRIQHLPIVIDSLDTVLFLVAWIVISHHQVMSVCLCFISYVIISVLFAYFFVPQMTFQKVTITHADIQ